MGNGYVPETRLLRLIQRGQRALVDGVLRTVGGLVRHDDPQHVRILGEYFNNDRQHLKDLVNQLPAGDHMVEVGSLLGFSTKMFLAKFDRVTSVDPYAAGYDDQHDPNSNRLRLETARDIFRIRFLDEPRVTQVNEPSIAAARSFDDHSLDFVYLDGSHTYRDVLDDIRAWLPKLRPGAYMAGDDLPWEGVKRAVEASFYAHDVIGTQWIATTNQARSDGKQVGS